MVVPAAVAATNRREVDSPWTEGSEFSDWVTMRDLVGRSSLHFGFRTELVRYRLILAKGGCG